MITAVVLAAGAARRFGEHKLLMPLGDRPLVRRVVEQVVASCVDRTLVVLGRDAGQVQQALEKLPVECVFNPRFAEGMSTSLRTGIESLPAHTTGAVIVLADQLLPSGSIIDTLVQAFRRTDQPIVVPVYAGRRGNPVLFAASVFAELRQVSGDEGARGVIARDPDRVEAVRFPFSPPPDVDTPADYERLLREREAVD
jgi:molybdenum cofactor cytidylyltransferase